MTDKKKPVASSTAEALAKAFTIKKPKPKPTK